MSSDKGPSIEEIEEALERQRKKMKQNLYRHNAYMKKLKKNNKKSDN